MAISKIRPPIRTVRPKLSSHVEQAKNRIAKDVKNLHTYGLTNGDILSFVSFVLDEE